MTKFELKQSFKSTLLAFSLIFGMAFAANAQKIAYVDVNQILNSIVEYQNAQTELDRQAEEWRQDIAQEYDKIKGMYNRYQAEQVLLSDDARRQREEEIMNKEKEVRDLQKRLFGPEGQLFKRRQELVQPIQDRVYQAIQEYAEERNYDFIFDKSAASGIIFSSDQYDKTDDVLRKLK
ncbi:MAG: OmpH family outer membrane protein [Saprospiraceae bacterium]|nr:OmpH family outer membrane protein [Saprospiraceae bacterium]